MHKPTALLPAAALSLAALTGAALSPAAAAADAQHSAAVREIEVVVDGGYQPARITIAAGERVRLRFVRREHTPCTREVVFPGLNIRRELPTDVPVVIDLPALAAGEYEFHCGMHMIHGALVVEPAT
jgi:plastocyanin domain-containing protein